MTFTHTSLSGNVHVVKPVVVGLWVMHCELVCGLPSVFGRGLGRLAFYMFRRLVSLHDAHKGGLKHHHIHFPILLIQLMFQLFIINIDIYIFNQDKWQSCVISKNQIMIKQIMYPDYYLHSPSHRQTQSSRYTALISEGPGNRRRPQSPCSILLDYLG